MRTESPPQASTLNSLQTYGPLSRNESPQRSRAGSVRRIRQGLGIVGLMQTIEANSNSLVLSTPKKALDSPQTIISPATLPVASKSPISTIEDFSDNRESKKLKQSLLREKRLQNIQAYRTLCDKGTSSPRPETAYNFKPSITNSLIKSPSSGTRLSTSSLRRRRNLKISQIATYDNLSAAFSLDGFAREHDSASRMSTTNTSPTFQPTTPPQKYLDPSIRIHTDFRDELPRDPPGPRMIELKLLSDSQVESQAVLPEGRKSSLRHNISTAHLKKRNIEKLSPKAGDASENHNFSTVSHMQSGIAQSTVHNSPSLADISMQLRRASPKEGSRISPEEWKEYSQKAQDKMPKLKPKLIKRENVTVPESLNNSDTQKMLQSIKPIYSEFITEKFDESIIARMKTFNTFGFTQHEKSQNQEISMFFNEVNQGRDVTGTLCMVDLWSLQQRKDVAAKARFSQEKHKLEKFAFYTSEQQKRLVPTKGQRAKQPKANGSMDKHKHAMLELAKSADKNQKFAFMSPMQRHMELKGKTFHEPKEMTIEAQEALKQINEMNMSLGTLMDDLKKFEEQNQNDYLNLLKVRSKNKKTELEEKNKMKVIENIKEFRSQQPK